ncbi:PD-(D/E)XK nuclease domain-containing protein [Bacteroides ovatus]|uniref:PD-(D/E)XK nuclease domain-containing protein n=1 Tax=Bacteroides ovatus TaxID=28116 RepID=UPI0032C12109
MPAGLLRVDAGLHPSPEYESSKGYADFYMMPDLVRQPDIVYSYIVEVKYARRDTSDADIALLKRDAAEQLRRYADDGKVARTKGNTRLGLITLVFKGWELVALEKLASRADCENASEA